MGVVCNKDGAFVVGDQDVAQRDHVIAVGDTSSISDVVKSRGSEEVVQGAAAAAMDVITTAGGEVIASTSGGKASRRETMPMAIGGEDPRVTSDGEVITASSSDDDDVDVTKTGENVTTNTGQDLADPTVGQASAVTGTGKDLSTNSMGQEVEITDASQDLEAVDPSANIAVTSTSQELAGRNTRQDLAAENNNSHHNFSVAITSEENETNRNNTALASSSEIEVWTGFTYSDSEDDDEEEDEYEHPKKEEEEEVVWLTQVKDREAYLRVMAPHHLCLVLRSTSPLQAKHINLAVNHLCRRWPWVRLRLKLRDQERQRIPWLCTLPRQPFNTQVADDDDCKWSIMENVQGRHRCLRGGPLFTVSLLGGSSDTSPKSSTQSTSVTTDSTSATSSDSCPTVSPAGVVTDHNSSTVGGKVDPATATGGSVDPSTATGVSVDPSTPTGGRVDPSTATGVSVDPSTPTGGRVDPSTATGGSVDPSTATGGSVDPSTATGGSVDPSTATGGNADLSTATGGNADPSTATGGNADPSTATGGNADLSITTGGNADPSTATGGNADPSTTGDTDNKSAFRHKCQLLLSAPKPFVDEATDVVICDTFVQLLDDVLAERIVEESVQGVREHPPQSETRVVADNHTSEFDEQIQLIQNLRSYCGVISCNHDILTGGYNCEENEVEGSGYTQRTVEPIISRNFINKCKAERVTYISGFTTCVSVAAMNFLMEAGADPDGGTIDVKHKVYVHYRWPDVPFGWQDNDGDDDNDSDSELTPERLVITITASPKDWNTKFWTTVNSVNKQQWDVPTGRKTVPQKIPYNPETEEDREMDFTPPRYPDVNLGISDVSIRETAEFCRCGEKVEATTLHTLSPLRHFLRTLNINLQVNEDLQNLHFYLNHSTLFVPAATGRRFADEIESVLKSSLKYR